MGLELLDVPIKDVMWQRIISPSLESGHGISKVQE